MTPAEIIDTIRNSGGRLWCDGDRLRYRAPAKVITPLLPDMKAHKPALLRLLAAPGVIKPKLAAANDNALPTPRRAVVYKVTVDGKRMTVIDTAVESYEKFIVQIHTQFGAGRVESIERQ